MTSKTRSSSPVRSNPAFCIAALGLVLLPGLTGAAPKAEPRVLPRVFLLDAKYIEFARQRVRQGDPHFTPVLERLIADANEALAARPLSVVYKDAAPPGGDKHDYMSMAPYYWPDPESTNGLPYIRRDGERNPEINRIPNHRDMSRMANLVETLALGYYFTGEQAYAAKAALLIRAWFFDPATRMNPNLQYAQAVMGLNTGRGIGLIESRALTQVVDAVGLLAGSRTWKETDEAELQAWFNQFLDWMLTSANGQAESAARNNHGTYYDVQATSFALFLDRMAVATNIIQTARQKRIAVQIQPDGRQPLELVRTRAWGYSVANLGGLMMLATMGDELGVDLWNYQTSDGRSISAALDYLAPFSLGEKKWTYQQIGGWPPQNLYPLLRLAALKYQDPKYRDWTSKIPPLDPESRAILLHPQVQPPDIHE